MLNLFNGFLSLIIVMPIFMIAFVVEFLCRRSVLLGRNSLRVVCSLGKNDMGMSMEL